MIIRLFLWSYKFNWKLKYIYKVVLKTINILIKDILIKKKYINVVILNLEKTIIF